MLIYNQKRDGISDVMYAVINWNGEFIDGETLIVGITQNRIKTTLGSYMTKKLAQMELDSIAEAFNAGTAVYYMTKVEE